MLKVKLTTVGNSLGIVLPKETLGKMNAEKGDTLFLVESPEGYLLTPYRQDFEKQLDIAKKTMRRYRNSLRELAK